MEVTDENVETIVKAARTRWKIENECFNTLKNFGYNIEHNFGHGEKLAFNMYLLVVLVFLVHQILELTDYNYQANREKSRIKSYLWEKIRSMVSMVLFDCWDDLMHCLLDSDGLKYNRN